MKKNTKDFILHCGKQAPYRVLVKQITNVTVASLTKLLSASSSFELAKEILESQFGHVIIKGVIGAVINQIETDNFYVEKIQHEFIVSTIADGQSFIIESVFSEVINYLPSILDNIKNVASKSNDLLKEDEESIDEVSQVSQKTMQL